MPEFVAGMHPIVWLLSVLAVVGVPAVSAVAVARISGRQKAHSEVIGEVRDQVSNDHPTNLRDDLDRVDEKVDQVDTKVDQLTGKFDLLTVGLDSFMAEMRTTALRQEVIAAKYHPEETRK